MTVAELRVALANVPGDAVILVSGLVNSFNLASMRVTKIEKYKDDVTGQYRENFDAKGRGVIFE